MLITSCVMAKGPITPAPTVQTAKPLPIAIVPQDGFNLLIEEQLDPYNVIVKLTTPAHNWFAGAFTNLPTDKEITIGLSMAGNDTKGNEGNVKKWEGLRPVMTYADPAKYETYEWYIKDEKGRWSSGDPFRGEEKHYFGTGEVPEQTVVPAAVAAQFLFTAAGKTYWSPWREVDRTEAIPTLNIFRITHRFDLPQATLAMRIPYTYTYLQAFIERLQAASLPGVFVDEVGTTPEGRKLQVIRLEDPTNTGTAEERQTVLIIAREHSTEAASSWVLQGTLNALLDKTPEAQAMRQARTWLFIPIQDPDGSANSTFNTLTDRFRKPNDPQTPDEVFDYTRYFTDYVNTGRTLDVVISLHNVEASECPNAFSPFADARYQESVIAFNKHFFQALEQQGYRTGAAEQNWGKGLMTMRLYGWCALHFGSFDLAFELNDRYPYKRLSLAQLQGIGNILTQCITQWSAGEEEQRWHRQVRDVLLRRSEARAAHFAREGRKPEDRTKYEMVTLGY